MRRRRGLPTGCPLGVLVLVSAGLAMSTSSARGQGYRGEARVGTGYLEARPLARDSLPESEVEGTGLRRRLADGTVVTCTQGDYCRWYRAGDIESLFVTTQDLTVTGWTRVQGLSGRVHLRGRYGSDDFWPQASQEFEVVSAYADYDRSEYRARAGRIIRTDGLGYYNFDGGSFLWRGWRPFWIEAYGGWSLARGLNVPRSGDLVSRADPLAPDDRGFIVGAEAGGRLGRIISGRVSYQREIRTDRLALYSERVSLDARAFLEEVTFDLSAEYDWTYEQWNEVRLRGSAPLPAELDIVAEARHHSPFFELWTIWGAFSPVGFNEGRLTLAWSRPELGLRLEAGGAYRDYEAANAGPDDSNLRDDGWRAFANGDWRGGPWFASGGYRYEAGFGAARNGGDLRAGRIFDEGTYVSVRGSLTQTFGEFRLNEQVVSGVGLDGALRLGEFSLNGGLALYHIDAKEREPDGSWTQTRVYSSLSYRFGRDPGLTMSNSSGGSR